MPKQGHAVCLAAGRAHPKLRAGRRYTVRRIHSDGDLSLADAATGEAIVNLYGAERFEDPSLLAPAEEAEELPALHCALYLGREPGVVCAVLEAHGEVSGEGGVRVRGRGLRGRGRPRLWGSTYPSPSPNPNPNPNPTPNPNPNPQKVRRPLVLLKCHL